MTEQELLSADLVSLSAEDLQRRSLIVNIRRQERETEQIEYENERFKIAKDERLRARRLAVENAQKEREKVEAEQATCAHKTGGEGLAGILAGDGAIYGSSTAVLMLPTQEIYVLCCRCSKEWHNPATCQCGRYGVATKRAVVEGKASYEDFVRQSREFQEALRLPRKSFAPWNGEYCAASTFNIPELQSKREKDNRDFEAFLLKREKGRKGELANAV